MNSARCVVGIWNQKNMSVFVFGGYGPNTTSEKYTLATKIWTPLPNPLQQPKVWCSVCEHSTGVYLSGNNNSDSSSIEFFNSNHETFTLLRTDTLAYAAIMCCFGDELYYLRQDKIEWAGLSKGPTAATLSVKSTIPQLGNGQYWCCCPLKQLGKEVIGVFSCSGSITGLFSFNSTKSELTQVANFTY